MKKINKALWLIGMAVVTISGTKLINSSAIQQHFKSNEISMQAFTDTPSNILDNMFVQDNMNIIPFIFTNSNQTISKETIINDFSAKGLTVTSDLKDIVGTGTEVRIKQKNTVYTILIYGDVNGNGKVDLIDAQNIIMHYKDPVNRPFSRIQLLAADTYNTNTVINLTDAQRVIMLKKGTIKECLLKQLPEVLVDNVAPEFKMNGQAITDVINITEGDTYNPTITAYDAVDGDVSADIMVSGDTVNPNVPGSYHTTYTVFDRKGNKAEVTINVNVAEKVVVQDGIAIIGTPNRAYQYPYKEEMKLTIDKLDLTGITLRVTENGTTTENVAITADMLSTEADLTTAGIKTIKVSYPNNSSAKMNTSFEVQVLNPIDSLKIDNTNMENARKVGNNYEVDLNKNFTLGVIKTNGDSSTTSTLALEQLQQVAQQEGITIQYELSGNDILVKGSANKAQEYSIDIPYIKEPNNTQTGISLKITAKTFNPILTNINLGQSVVNLNLDRSAFEVPVEFLDQNDIPMELQEDKIQIIDGTTVAVGKLGIKLPKMKIVGNTNSGYEVLNDNAVEVSYGYKNDDANSQIVEKIKFKLANTNKKLVDLDDIQFIVKDQEKASLTVNINYTTPTSLTFTSNPSEIGTIDGIYTVKKGAEYIWGRVIANENEKPILLSEIKVEEISGNASDVEIAKLCYDETTGDILVKGTINVSNKTYEIRVTNTVTNKSQVIEVKALDVPIYPDNMKLVVQERDTLQEINELSFQKGKGGIKEILLKAEDSVADSQISDKVMVAKNFSWTSDKNNYLKCEIYKGADYENKELIELLPDSDGDYSNVNNYANSGDDKAVVKYIKISVTQDAVVNDSVKLTLKFFKGLPGLEVTKVITVKVAE